MAFELLVGKRPFVGETLEEITHAHLHKLPPPTNLPPHLDRIVRNLLAKDPAIRATPKAFLQIVQNTPQAEANPCKSSPENKPPKAKGLFGLFRKK